MQLLVENNKNLKILYSEIKNDQNKFLIKFKSEEDNLAIKLSDLNELKLILNNEELEIEINEYNNLLNEFNMKIERFNSHYDLQINNLKNNIINKIIEVLKEFSIENKIDLILDVNNYILSNNSINITDLISLKLNNLTIETNFEKYN
jgi:Skp family chaperone for outer membrane proteins